MTTITPTNGDAQGSIKVAGVPVAHQLADVEDLAHKLRLIHRKIGEVSWALDEGLSAIRKTAGGYRQPDPATGRPVEFDGIAPAVLARRVLHAARVLRRLEEISLD
jgi:hypothetical protein